MAPSFFPSIFLDQRRLSIFWTILDVNRTYRHLYVVSAIGGFVYLVFVAWYTVNFVTLYVIYIAHCPTEGESCYTQFIGSFVFTTCAQSWISEWLSNTVRSTMAGVTWILVFLH